MAKTTYKKILNKLPLNTLLAMEVSKTAYNAAIDACYEMYPIKPPFYISIHFFPADDYLLNYETKTLDDFCTVEDSIVTMEFKYFIKQLCKKDPRALAILLFDSSVYFYKDFYGRALLDYKHIFFPETYDIFKIHKLTKEILYDYIINNRTDK